MKGHLVTYTTLFGPESAERPGIDHVEIPLIQRDYAQGRPDSFAREVRDNFLEALLDALAGDEPLSLDFVYGRIEAGTLYPLDGQQRLTTLFLLHWYLASSTGNLDPQAAWTQFSYSTRPSARLFCQRLSAHALPPTEARPSRWIIDQPWYLHVWRNDPTIRAMLAMLDAIASRFRSQYADLDLADAWDALTRTESPAISFYLLPLEDMQSDEDLYIKMNSRGKPLTPFENFKAKFEQDISHSEWADDFAHKVDGAWSDLLWPYHGGDNIVDDEFFRYFDYLTEICEFREGRTATRGRLGPRARATFGAANVRATEHLTFLFGAFDSWLTAEHIEKTFGEVLSTAVPGTASYDEQKVLLFGATSTNLFEQCCHSFPTGNGRAFTAPQSLLLYAVLLHVMHESADFPRRLRALRNLITASEDEIRRDAMPGLLADVEELILSGDLEALKRFSTNQVEDERRKFEFLTGNPDLASALFRLEDSPILRGILSAFELEPDTFEARAHAFETVFADPSLWSSFTGALLATGDYQRRRPRSPAWQFGTASPTNEAIWRELLTAASREELTSTRSVLGALLDGVASAEQPVSGYLANLITSWLAEREAEQRFDWRYYLVKYQAREEGTTGIYFGEDGVLGYSLCMLRTKQRNGWYRDPILLEVWRACGAHARLDDPWFTGYETTPRWLRLVQSRIGVRSVAAGYELMPPEDPELHSRFDQVCAAHGDVEPAGDHSLLRIPQVDHGDGAGPIDSVDRIIVGAEFVMAMLDAGL